MANHPSPRQPQRLIDWTISACRDCGAATNYGLGLSYWLIGDDLWAQVVGEPIVLCPECFTLRARKNSVEIHWEAIRDA